MAVYHKLNAKIEKVSEIYYFIVMKLAVPGALLSALILTTASYFSFHLGNESYYLPYPLLYVFVFITNHVQK